jgi:hypothetical protein
MALATRGPIRDVYFGFNLQLLFVRIDFDDPARVALANCDALRIGIAEPAGFDLRIEQPASPRRTVRLLRQGKPVPAAGVEVGIDRIVELAVPFDLLGLKVDEPLQIHVEIQRGGQSVDRAPREGTIGLTRPSPDFEHIMWDV